MSKKLIGYLAPEGFEVQLEKEIGSYIHKYGRLYLVEDKGIQPLWALNTWRNPQFIEVESISDAAKKLKSIQRNWAFYPYTHIRRASLIEEKLPYISKKPLAFPGKVAFNSLGSWTLVEENLLLASSKCSSIFPNGEVHFIEDKEGPSRAYLKLWESLTRLQRYPKTGEKCLEIGASPGGWTWSLAQLGAEVIAVDRAPLDPKVDALSNVHFIKGDAFKMTPEEVEEVDWIFSDVICYPDKLYEWVSLWLESGKCRNFVCTIKLQREGDEKAIEKFRSIPGSSVVHLYHNKHELTWSLVSCALNRLNSV